MRTFHLPLPATRKYWPEHNAVHAYDLFQQYKARTIDHSTPSGSEEPKPITRYLEFCNYLPVSKGIYIFHCKKTLEKVDEIQDMLMQLGLTLREMSHWRLDASGHDAGGDVDASVDDGKVAYLENHFQAWVVHLGEIWKCLTTPGMLELNFWVVGEAARMVPVTEEVRMFVREMEVGGVGFLSEEWDEEARLWMENMLAKGEWVGEGEDWREEFCEMVAGGSAG